MAENKITADLIAMCGMDCRLCRAYQREKNGCAGCRAETGLRLASCEECKIRNCAQALSGNFLFCSGCASYPCKLIVHIDKRYRNRYGMSMVENLELIKRSGMQAFLANEEKKWTCPACGQLLSVHKPYCLNCHYKWQ